MRAVDSIHTVVFTAPRVTCAERLAPRRRWRDDAASMSNFSCAASPAPEFPFVAIGIISAPTFIERRAAIRATWLSHCTIGQYHMVWKFLFALQFQLFLLSLSFKLMVKLSYLNYSVLHLITLIT